MKSIKAQLLLWLVPSFIIIAMLATTSLYLSEKLRLDANLDNELEKLVRMMKLANKRPVSRFDSPIRAGSNLTLNAKLTVNDTNRDYYFQSWNEKGETLRKSLNLGDSQLINPNKEKKLKYNTQLISGDDLRVQSFTLLGSSRRGSVEVSLAISRKEVNQRLDRFALQLLIGGIFFCLLLSSILIFVIKKALVPIKKLSEQVAKVEAGSLDNRLTDVEVPIEIDLLVERLNQLLGRLEQSFARERQFNNDLAHELRTPLAAIRSTSEVALKWPEQSSIEDYRYIAESSAQLQQTIDSLLSLARIGNSGNQVLSESVNLFTLVQECIAFQSEIIKTRGITMIILLNKDHCLQNDPHLLRIITSNLVSNAVEYAPDNSDVIINSEGDNSILRVINTAPNLTESDVVTMFDRLWRKDSSRTGTDHVGLGLSIAQTASQAISLNLVAELCHKQRLHMSLKTT